MKVSAQEEYGLRCLMQLAPLGAGEFLTLGQIAEREGLSQANAGKVLWLLNKAGLVTSIRGTKGGYMLARPAAEIRLSEIIKVLDEGEVDGHCKTYPGVLDSCLHTGDCGIRVALMQEFTRWMVSSSAWRLCRNCVAICWLTSSWPSAWPAA